jgi:hypothetical protein
MVAAVLFTDIEATAITYLDAALEARGEAYTDNVTVSNEYQGETPTRQVVVTRDGGPRAHLFDQPRLRINVWAEDDPTVTDLALMCDALLMAWPNGAPVTYVRRLSGPSPINEPNERSRRFLLIEARARGSQLT